MTALELHFPERREVARWMLSAIAIVIAHAIAIGALAAWYARMPTEPTVLPPIAITFAAPTSAPAPDQDKAIGTPQQEQHDQPPEPPKAEQPVEQSVEKLMPPQPAEVTLPKPMQRPKEPKKQIAHRQPQPARAPAPRTEAVKQASAAASLDYRALVSEHLRRFVHKQVAATYGSGRVVVGFLLNREGQVLSSRIEASSGNAALDREALAVVSRANPFPPFPPAKTQAQDSFSWPVQFQ